MWAATRMLPAGFPPSARGAGFAVALCGGVVALWAITSFRRQRTTIHPMHPHEATALVVRGPNRFSRNPMYVGLLLVLVGWALWLRQPVAMSGVLVAWGYLWRFQVLPEERALYARFGDDYAAYTRRVRRWV
jgi:protein-S-isoprenylcysteine O-methyltransferase Ste14